jgi:hypothetical protein
VAQQQEPEQQPGPESIDINFAEMARRRQIREVISMVCTGIVVIAMVMTFYRILTS